MTITAIYWSDDFSLRGQILQEYDCTVIVVFGRDLEM